MLVWGMNEEREHHSTKNPASEEIEVALAPRRSFVLRVWIDGSSGEIRGYLSDVRTNVRHPFKKTSDLPPLIRSMFDLSKPKPDE